MTFIVMMGRPIGLREIRPIFYYDLISSFKLFAKSCRHELARSILNDLANATTHNLSGLLVRIRAFLDSPAFLANLSDRVEKPLFEKALTEKLHSLEFSGITAPQKQQILTMTKMFNRISRGDFISHLTRLGYENAEQFDADYVKPEALFAKRSPSKNHYGVEEFLADEAKLSPDKQHRLTKYLSPQHKKAETPPSPPSSISFNGSSSSSSSTKKHTSPPQDPFPAKDTRTGGLIVATRPRPPRLPVVKKTTPERRIVAKKHHKKTRKSSKTTIKRTPQKTVPTIVLDFSGEEHYLNEARTRAVSPEGADFSVAFVQQTPTPPRKKSSSSTQRKISFSDSEESDSSDFDIRSFKSLTPPSPRTRRVTRPIRHTTQLRKTRTTHNRDFFKPTTQENESAALLPGSIPDKEYPSW